VEGSILEIDKLQFGKFDFIECAGVLHHLNDFVEGLRKLSSVLKKDGGMAIMVYGKYGRSGVYEMQSAMNTLFNSYQPEEKDTSKSVFNFNEKVRLAKKFFKMAPSTSTIKSNARFAKATEYDNEEFFDTFLHPQDTAFTVPDILKWISDCDCGLEFVDFYPNALYDPFMNMHELRHDAELMKMVTKLNRTSRYIFSEALTASLAKHYFYLTKTGLSTPSKYSTIAQLLGDRTLDEEVIPCVHTNLLESFKEDFEIVIKSHGFTQNVTLGISFEGVNIYMVLDPYALDITRSVDCYRNLQEIFEFIRFNNKKHANLVWGSFYEHFQNTYHVLSTIGLITLRVPTTFESYSISMHRDEL